jgi:hypothetical protein
MKPHCRIGQEGATARGVLYADRAGYSPSWYHQPRRIGKEVSMTSRSLTGIQDAKAGKWLLNVLIANEEGLSVSDLLAIEFPPLASQTMRPVS